MKSPFIRFSHFVRSPLAIASIGLTTLWGCRHVPGTHRLGHRVQSTHRIADHDDYAEDGGSYEEPLPPTADIIDQRCSEPPAVKIGDGDVPDNAVPKDFFAPMPSVTEKPAAPKPASPVVEPKDASNEAVEKTVPVKKPTVEKRQAAPEKSDDKPAKPAPNGKLDVPPEPDDLKPKAEGQPKTEGKSKSSDAELPEFEESEGPKEQLKKPSEVEKENKDDVLEFDEPNASSKPNDEPKAVQKPETSKIEDDRLNEFADELAASLAATKKAAVRQEQEIVEKSATPSTIESSIGATEKAIPLFGEGLPQIVPNKPLPAKDEAVTSELPAVTPLFAGKLPAPAESIVDLSESKPEEEVPLVEELQDKAPLENEVLSLDAHCDGLVFDSQGFGYVSHRDHIVRFSPSGESSVWATLKGPKGHQIEPEGTHLVCDTERRAVLRLSFDGKVIGVAANDCDGAPLRAPHEIAVDPRGGFYFTDPGYVQVKTPIGKLHYVDRLGKVSVVAAKIGFPTGVVYDPVRLRVLVVESQFSRVLEFRLTEPGVIEAHQVFAELPKAAGNDYHLAGLCLDADGNLYVTQQQSKMVLVFDAQGRSAGKFPTGNVLPSSVALRSPEADELFFTGAVSDKAKLGKVIRLNLGK